MTLRCLPHQGELLWEQVRHRSHLCGFGTHNRAWHSTGVRFMPEEPSGLILSVVLGITTEDRRSLRGLQTPEDLTTF